MTRLAHDRYCDEIAEQMRQFRAVVTSGAELSAPVPTCPDWSLEELARHLGGALRWVELTVRTRAAQEIPEERVPGAAGPKGTGDAAAWDVWLAESAEQVVTTLREAGADTPVWTWAADRTAGFWARRMAHEVTVHRADATLAAELPYEVAPEIAADAIDEWLEIVRFMQRTRASDAAADLRGQGESLHLQATGAPAGLDAEWLVELAEDGVRWRRGRDKAAVALRGPLTDVLLAFYRRLPLDSPRVEVLGDRRLLEFWLERATFG